MDEVVRKIVELGHTVEPCGSRVTCVPPPLNTDQDYLVEVLGDQNEVSELVATLLEGGYEFECGEHYQMEIKSDFMSFRKGEANLIVTGRRDFAARHRVATTLCRRLNLQNKPDRIALFQAVLYGQTYADRPSREWGRPPVNPQPDQGMAF